MKAITCWCEGKGEREKKRKKRKREKEKREEKREGKRKKKRGRRFHKRGAATRGGGRFAPDVERKSAKKNSSSKPRAPTRLGTLVGPWPKSSTECQYHVVFFACHGVQKHFLSILDSQLTQNCTLMKKSTHISYLTHSLIT